MEQPNGNVVANDEEANASVPRHGHCFSERTELGWKLTVAERA
jgi:hypothetical protein